VGLWGGIGAVGEMGRKNKHREKGGEDPCLKVRMEGEGVVKGGEGG